MKPGTQYRVLDGTIGSLSSPPISGMGDVRTVPLSAGDVIMTTGAREGKWYQIITPRGLAWTSSHYLNPPLGMGRWVEELS